METFFIQNDSILFRDFLIEHEYNIVIEHPNLTGILCKDSQQLFFIGMTYGRYLSSLQDTKTLAL